MAQIIQSAYGDQRLKLGNEMFGRQFNFGTTWDHIRIGMRYRFGNSGIDLNPCQFAFGICEGTTRMFKDASCTDWLGHVFCDPVTGSWWDYQAGPAQYYWMNAKMGYCVNRIAGVDVYAGVNGSNMTMCCDPLYLYPLYLEFNKKRNAAGQVTSIVVGLITVYGHVAESCSQGRFYEILEDQNWLTSAAWPYGGGSTLYVLSNFAWNTLGMSYSGNALWDTVNVSWSCSDPQHLEIADIAVNRFQ